MKNIITILLIALFADNIFCSEQNKCDGFILPEEYSRAYNAINNMLNGSDSLDFKTAVFLTEDAYCGGHLNFSDFETELLILERIIDLQAKTNFIDYDFKDKDDIVKHASIFKVITDSIVIPLDSTHIFVHSPYMYDFKDPWGEQDWSSMFVTKLLDSGTGNCHSLPYLYKIMSDMIGVGCNLAFAPNHIYVKLFSEKTGWYNVELTSGTFPVDAWIIASGYINTDAIRNGLYMHALSDKESIANCLIDLAHGYQRKFGNDNMEFIIKCCDLALKYHPNNINALLTKAETQSRYIVNYLKKNHTNDPGTADDDIKKMYKETEKLYANINNLGYKQIPKEVYIKWMESLRNYPVQTGF